MRFTTFTCSRSSRAGFTLVEVSVVALIISFLAAIAVPSIKRIMVRSRSSAVINDLRVFSGALQAYMHASGSWPPASAAGQFPAAMQGYLTQSTWTRITPIGGYYTWATNSLQLGRTYRAVIIICSSGTQNITSDQNQLLDIDKKLDNGNLTTGNVLLGAQNYLVYVVEP